MLQAISGTIIQRAFVGPDVGTILHVASAPFKEIAFDEEDFVSSIGELVASPTDNILEGDEYSKYAHLLEDQPSGAYPKVCGASINHFSWISPY
jgi:hypothetical protein